MRNSIDNNSLITRFPEKTLMSIEVNLLFSPPSALIWPETLHSLHSFHTPPSYLLVCVSTGQSTYRDKECVRMLAIPAPGMEGVGMQLTCSQKAFSSSACTFLMSVSDHINLVPRFHMKAPCWVLTYVLMVVPTRACRRAWFIPEMYFFGQWNPDKSTKSLLS